eukprot:11177556-Lingulodinium_polyedra.AAC.1
MLGLRVIIVAIVSGGFGIGVLSWPVSSSVLAGGHIRIAGAQRVRYSFPAPLHSYTAIPPRATISKATQ